MIKLYSYFRSSSSYRVRIALNLKNLDYETIPVHLVKDGGEQFKPNYEKINPMQRVPALVHEGQTLSQSVAIIEYLEESFPAPPLFPNSALERAKARQLIETINSDIQPLQNLSVLKKLVREYGLSEEQKVHWIQHWIGNGFQVFEKLAEDSVGDFSLGDKPSAVDCFLIPQIYNAIRWGVDMQAYPVLKKIDEQAQKHPAFVKAHPDNQPDTLQD